MRKIIWSARAASDLVRLKNIIQQDKPKAAVAFIKNIQTKVLRLKKFPFIGRVLPELNQVALREIIVSRYRIVYRVTKNEIRVLTIFH